MILLVGNPLAKPTEIEAAFNSYDKVSFEQLDRISQISLSRESFSSIVTGIEPKIFKHSNKILGIFNNTLVPNGKLTISEPIFDEFYNQQIAIEQGLDFRTERELISDLTVNGFVSIEISKVLIDPLDLEKYSLMLDRNLNQLSGHIYIAQATATKPSYSVGTSAKLSWAKKSVKQAPKVWQINTDDQDIDLIDEDQLLDETDLVVPPTAPAGDCSTRKKACKDCSCGRAELEAQEQEKLTSNITVVNPKKIVASSCGSCYLGDAFRCSTCPYLGMPAFKPGEKVVLASNFLKDDINL